MTLSLSATWILCGQAETGPKLWGEESVCSSSETPWGLQSVWCDCSLYPSFVTHFTSDLVMNTVTVFHGNQWPNDIFIVLRMTLLPLLVFFSTDGKGEISVLFIGQPQSTFSFIFSHDFLNCHLWRGKINRSHAITSTHHFTSTEHSLLTHSKPSSWLKFIFQTGLLDASYM